MTSSMVMTWITPGTSPVDWCEANYTVTPYIAEFVNTISNVFFLFAPMGSIKLWSSYAKNVSPGIHLVWIFFAIIGVSSAYFHATLSLLGQLLDELSIVWVLMVSYSLFTPISYRPKIFQKNQKLYRVTLLLLGIFVTASCFVQPVVNAYALFIFGVPAVTMLAKETRRSKEQSVARLGKITLIALLFAAISWVSDKFLCSVWRSLNFAVLHGIWHVLIFVGSYTTQVLFCYFHAVQDVPTSKPLLKFWPKKNWGLPYVECSDPMERKTP